MLWHWYSSFLYILGKVSHLLTSTLKACIDIGTGSKQGCTCTGITSLRQEIELLWKAIPGIHTITVCEYNPTFYKKGKPRSFNILLKNLEYQDAINKKTESDLLQNERKCNSSVLEEFICRMHNMPRSINLNDTTHHIFSKTYLIKNVTESFARKFNNFKATNLLPRKEKLHQKLLRTQ